MKHLLITTIAAVLVVGCGKPQPPDISLFDAAGKGNLEAVKQHIAAGTDIDQTDPKPEGNNDSCLGISIAFGRSEVAIALIDAGADLSHKNKNGTTPLHIASFLCYPDITQALIDKGADKNARDNEGGTPLEGVLLPWDQAKGIYDFLNGVIYKPLGVPLDYNRIKSNRPKIVSILKSHG